MTKGMRAIVNLCRSLSMLHPFPDGNQRTLAFALLTKLLIENGFSPAVIKAPYMFGEYRTLDSLASEVHEGTERFARLKTHPLNKSDIQYIASRANRHYTVARELLTSKFFHHLTPNELNWLWNAAFRNSPQRTEFVAKFQALGRIKTLPEAVWAETFEKTLKEEAEMESLVHICLSSGRARELSRESILTLYKKTKASELRARLKTFL